MARFSTWNKVLLLLLVYPVLAYCLWTKWVVASTGTVLNDTDAIDFLRLHISYYGLVAAWCTLLLWPGRGALFYRSVLSLILLYFIMSDLAYSTAIFYTGSLPPYDVSFYAARATNNLPFAIEVAEWISLSLFPLIFLGAAYWKLKQLRRHSPTLGNRFTLLFGLLLVSAAIPPATRSLETNIARPSHIYQIAEFLSKKSFWPQALAIETAHTHELRATPISNQHPNIVIIGMESVSAGATGIYNDKLASVTPFLNSLAQNSLVVRNAFAVVPHTSKALVAINCGIAPSFMHPIFESTFGIYQPCMPALLSQQGYRTLFIQSPTEHFENRRGTATQMGYQDFIANEQLDSTGYQLTSYFGYEDDILLNPGKDWLLHQQRPFMAFYMTGSTHHPYWAPDSLPGQTFDADDKHHNNYLNAVRYLDRFIENLMAQYKALGLYENTIFVIVGDHGESFGLHPRMQHNASLYQEVMRVPLLIHAPGIIPQGREIQLASQLDIMPTVMTLAGFSLSPGLDGINLADATQQRTTAIANCWYDDWCMASSDGRLKYIHNFEQKGDEVYDLEADPFEQHNVIDQHADWADQRRQELLALKERNDRKWRQFLGAQDPEFWSKRDATLGTPISLLQPPATDSRFHTQSVH